MKRELSPRERLILCEVVALYLERGEPVASGALARVSQTGLSAASLRNTMAELEELGYLFQLHTSAGRIPTDEALRVYVDTVSSQVELAEQEKTRLASSLKPYGSLEEMLSRASQVLAEITAEAGLAAAPAPREAALESIHFVKVSPSRVVAVLVTQGGMVDSRLVQVDQELSPEELEQISNFCTSQFRGLRLSEIRLKLGKPLQERQIQQDTLATKACRLTWKALESELQAGGEVYLKGAEHLLAKAGPKELVALKELLRALADKNVLLQLLAAYLSSRGPRVVFGRELFLSEEGELSLIVTSFHLKGGEEGLVGVLGFKRMNYPRILPLVDYMGRLIAKQGDWRC